MSFWNSVDHLHASVVQHHDGVTVGGHLGLKCLVLLDFSLKIRWIFVALIAGSLELLIDPALQFIRISSKILEPPAVFQFLSS